ncbi:MAG: DUF2231 domain-containing protein [Chthoniobacterales bacterium]
MISLPNPLHPAIVHFPIVLILIGALVAVAAVFLRRWNLSWIAAGLLTFGALGSFAATWSGDEAGETVGKLSPQAEKILEEHEEWGEMTRNVALVAAFLAVGTVATTRFPKVARSLSVGAALTALWASYCVAVTGHYGGLLVYQNGVGITAVADNSIPAVRPEKHGDKDDD